MVSCQHQTNSGLFPWTVEKRHLRCIDMNIIQFRNGNEWKLAQRKRNAVVTFPQLL